MTWPEHYFFLFAPPKKICIPTHTTIMYMNIHVMQTGKQK